MTNFACREVDMVAAWSLDRSGAQTPTANRRNAARHRLLAAAPFVESSLRTGCGILTDREIFDSEKQRTDPPLDSRIFRNRNRISIDWCAN